LESIPAYTPPTMSHTDPADWRSALLGFLAGAVWTLAAVLAVVYCRRHRVVRYHGGWHLTWHAAGGPLPPFLGGWHWH
jgi:hypothetical protein